MKQLMIGVSFGLMLLAPVCVLAVDGHGGQGKHEMAHDMEHSGHGAAKAAAGSLMLPEQTVDGITAMVHLKDVKEAMAKMGMKHTHHFMVMFKDAAGKHVEAQVAAVKIVTPDGKEGAPVELPSMQGHSGADVVLAAPGAYVFKVAAKLPGEKKVQYEFKTVLK